MKWKSSEGKLVLKITDDVTVRFVSYISFLIERIHSPPTQVLEVQNTFFYLPWPLRGAESLSDPENDE